MSKKYRLVTRSDMDGLLAAVLLRQIDLVDDIVFVHPKDVQDGKVELSENDITTNLPYDSRVYLSFDHHSSELERVDEGEMRNHIIDPDAPSTARVVYNYYGGKTRFPNISDDMLAAVDKADSAQFTLEEILAPTGWVLLSFIMDPRTGLGRFRDFRVANRALMMDLIGYCADHTIEEIMALPDVKERTDLYLAQQDQAREQITRCATVYDNLVVLELRNEETIYAANRFLIYALFPACNISVHVMWGVQKQNTVFAVGKSIVNRSSTVDIGGLMLHYKGGGHENAGTCQVGNAIADQVKQELIATLSQVAA
jgi:nanoRNase/pAp phosphatase (c-di-AMP/oligoRNAs hydrolase)